MEHIFEINNKIFHIYSMRFIQHNKPYYLVIDNILKNHNSLFEASHYYKGSRNAVYDISEHIFNDINNRRFNDFDSGYVFISNYGVAVTKAEADNIDMFSNFKQFPIYVVYDDLCDLSTYFVVGDRQENKNRVVVIANYPAITKYLVDVKRDIDTKKRIGTFNEAFDDDYEYYLLVPKVKHEFVHIRQNYGLDIDITKNKKMVNTDIEHFFKYNNDI